MTAQALTPIDDAASAYQAKLDELRETNLDVARHAAGVLLILGHRLAMMAQATDDPDQVRKAYDTFARKAEVPEKQDAQKAGAAVAAAILQIVLDDNVPQVAPKRRKTQDVEDAVEVTPMPLSDEPVDVPWSLDL